MSEMIQYIRKPGKVIRFDVDGNIVELIARGTPYGCLYAKKIMDANGKYKIAVGWSLCNKKDEFSKDEAVCLAGERAQEYFGTRMVIPHSIRNKFVAFCNRAKLYYQINEFTHTYAVIKEEVLNV